MNALVPGNTMNTKNFRCSYQLQCNLVFIGKFQLVICQSFLVAINKNLPFNLVSPICEIDKKFKKIFLDINFFFFIKATVQISHQNCLIFIYSLGYAKL